MPEKHKPFDPLDQSDLRLYQQLSDLLRVFDVTVIYNFYAAEKEKRERLVTEMTNFIQGDGYELLEAILGGWAICPLCPGARICTMCQPTPDMRVTRPQV